LQRLEVILEVRVDALAQGEEFPVNLVIAVAGLEEFNVLGAFLRDAEVSKDPCCHPRRAEQPASANGRSGPINELWPSTSVS
jgi:hypothetical protein